MKSLTFLAALLAILSACTPYQRTSAPAGALYTSPPSTDLGVYSTQVVGLRVGMTPRRIAQEVNKYGWVEDEYTTQTLEDLIQKDVDRARVSFDINQPKKGNIEIHFCRSKARFIRFSGKISESEVTGYIEHAKGYLNSLGHLKEKKDDLSYTMYYEPNRWANVSFTVYKYVKGQRDYDVWESVTDSTFCL